ncbi:hypothetical protein QFZ47_001526 [Variovorax paradoxus]|nr:DUF3304 domain-containing protein [Variovorax paradoxus]MDQ0587417.1 hypothetical protein [Variovorax paradoxus]
MKRRVTIQRPLGEALQFHRLVGREALSQAYAFDLDVLGSNAIDAKALLGKPATVVMGNTLLRKFIGVGKSTVCLARRQKLGWLAAGACALLVGCSDEMVPASVMGYNHMSDWGIESFTVDGAGGPNITPEAGGGKSSCCARIPVRWHAGMKVKVRWSYDTTQGGPRPPPPQEAVVEIPEYSKRTGDIQAHFYPNHKVKVVVSNYGIEHPRYPMSEEDKLPWETSKQLLEYEKEGRLPE